MAPYAPNVKINPPFYPNFFPTSDYDYDEESDTTKKIVENVSKIVNNFVTQTIPSALPDEDDEFDISGVLNSFEGNREKSTIKTEFLETTKQIINDITTPKIIPETNDVYETTESIIAKATDIPDKYDVTTTYEHILNIPYHSKDDHFGPDNMPYIILVVVLAVLIITTIIAIVIYQKRKNSASKDISEKVDKRFGNDESDVHTPQQVMYGERKQ